MQKKCWKCALPAKKTLETLEYWTAVCFCLGSTAKNETWRCESVNACSAGVPNAIEKYTKGLTCQSSTAKLELWAWNQGCGGVEKMKQLRLRSFFLWTWLRLQPRSSWFSRVWLRLRSSLFSWLRLLFVFTHSYFQLSWCASSWMENELRQVDKTKSTYQTFFD